MTEQRTVRLEARLTVREADLYEQAWRADGSPSKSAWITRTLTRAAEAAVADPLASAGTVREVRQAKGRTERAPSKAPAGWQGFGKKGKR